jgi:uncharacterized membrane protein
MSLIVGIAGGIGLGTALAYLFDPDRGRRRRAMARDKIISAAHTAGDALDTTSRDLRNRARGAMAAVRSALESDDVSDEVLVERVRARIGSVVRHSRSLDVTASAGRVTLCGPVLAHEVEGLLRRVSGTRGVAGIDNRLDVHDSADAVPGLQGQGDERRGPPRWEFMQENWSPTARLVGGGIGVALGWYGLRRSGLVGTAAGLGGLLLVGRAATNLDVERLLGLGGGRRGINVHKTITVNAPPDEVFRFWSNYENFPRFMSHVQEVRRSNDAHVHWTIAGPGGVPIEFDTVETRREPYRRIAWKTTAGAPVAHAGIVRFDPDGGGTRIDLRMSYNPPGGAVGHAIASLFGADPKSAMDEDFVRLKSLLEDGRTRAHGEDVGRSELA